MAALKKYDFFLNGRYFVNIFFTHQKDIYKLLYSTTPDSDLIYEKSYWL